MQVQLGGAPCAANQAIHIAFVQQHGTNQGEAAAHFYFCYLRRHAHALGHAVIGLPEIAVAMVLLNIHHVVIQLFFEAQAKFFDALRNHRRAANQCGASQAFIDHNLASAQHALIFTFGISNALVGSFLGCIENRLHRRAAGIHKALQLLFVGFHIGNRAKRHATVLRSLSHRWRNLHHEARIKGLGNQIFWAEGELFADISGSDHFALLGLRQLGNCMYRCNFHLYRDRGSARIECTAKDVGKTQNVVHLIGVIRAPRGHDRIVAHSMHLFGQDFWVRVGQRQDQRLGRHAFHHLRLQHATC